MCLPLSTKLARSSVSLMNIGRLEILHQGTMPGVILLSLNWLNITASLAVRGGGFGNSSIICICKCTWRRRLLPLPWVSRRRLGQWLVSIPSPRRVNCIPPRYACFVLNSWLMERAHYLGLNGILNVIGIYEPLLPID